ncbi:integral membrane protein [Streptomyces laurentii]|uniref:Integral membrane protein n=1 Tax=Streptomyces laurentii TaxID=39478 RepID=A0A160NZ79_STRLU|nr:integral membrane protein [Streptomyces laurentii]
MNDTPGWASPGSSSSDGDATGSTPQWSRNQPPAGQWQPPAAPAPGTPPPIPAAPQAGPGWGGPPPYGQWNVPQAAKPGVIALRPLTLGDILDGAVTTLRRYWRTVLTVSVAVAAIMQVAQILCQRYLIPDQQPLDPAASPAEAMDQTLEAARTSAIGMAPASLIAAVATLLSAALLTVVISRAVLGKPIDLATAWREARPRLLPLLGLSLLVPLICAVVMFVGILPGLLLGSDGLTLLGMFVALGVVVWLWIRFALASPALMLERQGVIASMKRSAKLVQGAWWRVFGITVLINLLMALVAVILAIPFTALAMAFSVEGLADLANAGAFEKDWSFLILTGIGGVVTNALVYPIVSGVSVFLYIDQRIRREALDVELGRAAGLPGYGG